MRPIPSTRLCKGHSDDGDDDDHDDGDDVGDDCDNGYLESLQLLRGHGGGAGHEVDTVVDVAEGVGAAIVPAGHKVDTIVEMIDRPGVAGAVLQTAS